MSDMERRVEALEEQVATLTEALRTSLDWRIVSTTGRLRQTPAIEVKIGGQNQTKEVLDRL